MCEELVHVNIVNLESRDFLLILDFEVHHILSVFIAEGVELSLPGDAVFVELTLGLGTVFLKSLALLVELGCGLGEDGLHLLDL